MRFVLTLAIITTWATFGLPQDGNTTPQRIFTHDREIETSYDQVKEITTVRLNPMQVYGEPLASSNYIGGDEARFNASFTYPGRTLRAQPKRVLFSLVSTSEDWKYTDFRKLTALVDGKRLKLGPQEHVPSFTVNASANANFDDYISQGIAISLTYKTFLRIASGKKVQIRMGPREFELEVMKNKFVRAQVIIWYTLIDECLNVVKKWDQIEERLNAKVEGITDKSKSRIDAADTLADQTVKTLQSQNFYSYGWDALAKQLDSWVEKKVKSGRKRAFSNIIAIKSKNRAKHATAGAFSIAMIKDQDFCEGTCALLSVGLSKGTGEAGGVIPGHAIAAHFKDVQEIYLFDPNVGIFKSGSLDEFRRSLETLIGTVWTQDLKWKLDGTFGYSLFRMRPEVETNSVERGVPYSRSPEYTAAESKAEGIIPRALQK